MARIIELKWNCGDCDTKGILGRHKRCPSCGSPREKGEMQMDGLKSDASGWNPAPTVTAPDLLELFTAGADWFCTHCGSGNKGNGDTCSACAAPRYGKAEEDHPDFAGDHKKVIPEEHPEYAGDPEPRTEEPPVEESKEEDPDDDMLAPKVAAVAVLGSMPLVAGGVILIVLLIGLLVWALQTHGVTGTVQSMTWERTVHVEQWSTKTVRSWKHQTTERVEVRPIRGSGERAGMTLVPGSCKDEHYDDETYVCGNHQECKDIYKTETEEYACSKSESYVCGETCRDNGNGSATCTDDYCTRQVPDTCTRSKEVFSHEKCEKVNDYCERAIYKAKCSYETQEWRNHRTNPTRGQGKTFVWGEEPTQDDLRRWYSAEYTVKVAYTDRGKNQIHPIIATATETSRQAAEQAASGYATWEIGAPVHLDINNMGGVHSATHPNKEK